MKFIPATLLLFALALPCPAVAADMNALSDTKPGLEKALADIAAGKDTAEGGMDSAGDSAGAAQEPPEEIALDKKLATRAARALETGGMTPAPGTASNMSLGTSAAASCAPFADQQKRQVQQSTEYARQLGEAQKAQRAATLEYARQLQQEQIALRQKLVDYGNQLAEQQKAQATASVEYNRQLQKEQLALRQKLIDYANELKPQQDAMRCLPTDRFSTR